MKGIMAIKTYTNVEISMYTFMGQKMRVMQLAILFNEALQSANAIITRDGY